MPGKAVLGPGEKILVIRKAPGKPAGFGSCAILWKRSSIKKLMAKPLGADK
jgi:hypothetical protein